MARCGAALQAVGSEGRLSRARGPIQRAQSFISFLLCVVLDSVWSILGTLLPHHNSDTGSDAVDETKENGDAKGGRVRARDMGCVTHPEAPLMLGEDKLGGLPVQQKLALHNVTKEK